MPGVDDVPELAELAASFGQAQGKGARLWVLVGDDGAQVGVGSSQGDQDGLTSLRARKGPGLPGPVQAPGQRALRFGILEVMEFTC